MPAVPASLFRSQWPAAPARWPTIGVETLALGLSLFFSLASNGAVWQRVLADRSWAEPGTWLFAACLLVGLTAFQFVLLVLLFTRPTARWTATVLLLATACASYFTARYSVFFDAGMLRNILRTDTKEARELFSADLLLHLAWQAALPIWLVWKLPLARVPWPRAVLRRVLVVAGASALTVGAVMLVFQDLAGVARNQRELRFLVAPSNYLYALVRVATADMKTAAKPLAPIGTDAALGASWVHRAKPALFVIVVGETARAANWGLNGYARQTTPELAQLDVINFPDVESCGTATETSLPCMFAPRGRRDYDEDRIRSQQGLLHVLQRAQLRVLWRDNQSGCKSVCPGIEAEQLDAMKTPGLCEDGRCFDEILLDGLEAKLAGTAGRSQVLVLHQLGSHGPAYSTRYPRAFRKFAPTCESGELRKCTREEIANAYDNTILYTDHMLAQTIRFLQSQQARYDTALLYVSDHGESLGESNVYLHGLPWPIAPKEQKHVPMVMWLSPGFAQSFGVDRDCLRAHAAQPASHDHLFHTVLGLLDVFTAVQEPALDLTRACHTTAG